ncbi:hypothetical protein EGI20_13520 [Aquitalea sp. S1-19]|nr:hypothetical protein [Aquitalea sp. S1-19]
MGWPAWAGFVRGLFLRAAILITSLPGGMPIGAWRCVGLALLMAIALLPIQMIPLLGLGIIETGSAPYAKPTIFLFLGGFIRGLALERGNLHRRIVLLALRVVGCQSRRQIAGFILATAS